MSKLCVASIIGIVASLAAVGWFFSVLFVLIVPEIHINADYKPAICTVVDSYIVEYKCCRKRCYGCSECSRSNPSCSTRLRNEDPGPCCDGYYCCQDCCDTCCSTNSKGRQTCTKAWFNVERHYLFSRDFFFV